MGKKLKLKDKPAASPSATLSAYFPASGSVESQPRENTSSVMAMEQMPNDHLEHFISRGEIAEHFAKLEKTITAKMDMLIAPLSSQIADLKCSLTQAVQTADTAMELGLTLQDNTRQLQQQADCTEGRLLLLENQARSLNLKFSGFEEEAEQNKELTIFMAEWLASQIELEDGVLPLLDIAFRIGPPRRRRSQPPRDIIVKFRDFRTKQKVWQIARIKGKLTFSDQEILVMQDLSAETLNARRLLKPVTTLLQSKKVRYRWNAYVKLQVLHQGQILQATDLESGAQLLKDLDIPLPEDFPLHTRKAKQQQWKTT